MGRKYPVGKEGEIIQPVMKGYRMRCCDCKVVHVIDFFVVKCGRGHKVRFKISRDARSTAASRKNGKHLMNKQPKH